MKIIFETFKGNFEGILNDSETAKKIYQILPLETKVSTWGEEIYFPIPLESSSGTPTEDVEVGDIAFWPDGNCLCIFFGRTPRSINDNPRPASGVIIIGKIKPNLSGLKKIKAGEKIRVKKLA